MLDDLFYMLVGIFVIVGFAVARPTRARCPQGFYAEGIRPTGATSCVRAAPIGGPDCAGKTRCDYSDVPPPPRFPIQIYCTGGSVPIAGNDGRTVGCTRRFGS